MSAAAGAAETVDARGLRCPLPVIRLAARAKELAAGTEVAVLSTDPAARYDVPAWARMRGHETVAVTESDGVWTLTVRLRRSDT
ncbi:sulfurtransferase TusA family protein [Myceligenerans xiligouense]|uniref:tRNA 2-thiouridine synthesizing protein A n=1 Tax=Myceligenerans xiligouense TaxID=253184 RepID=A0A3N4YNA7_9MICO|nr:sulfurtransferase TusA family protein [Myceligenerans xiligouense]RPF20824.1 tRNA 2-thiouridine synthesizing protein A [Myceligenerans xiligouense]